MVTAHRVTSERLTLTLEGTFDASEAWRVHDVLAHLVPPTRVSLDFRKVRAFHDFAIALLAKDILSMRGHIEATGLCQHQRRILKYFGVDETGLAGSPALDSRSSQEPEPPHEDASLGT